MHPFEAIPMELLGAICELIPSQILLQARLVNKAFARACDQAFIQAIFTMREHLVTKYSLLSLVSILSVPRLSSKLEKIALIPCQPNFDKFKPQKSKTADGSPPNEPFRS